MAFPCGLTQIRSVYRDRITYHIVVQIKAEADAGQRLNIVALQTTPATYAPTVTASHSHLSNPRNLPFLLAWTNPRTSRPPRRQLPPMTSGKDSRFHRPWPVIVPQVMTPRKRYRSMKIFIDAR